jgi:hypothetical protein
MAADTHHPTLEAFATHVGEDAAPRRCDNCGAGMTHLSDLPGHLGGASIRIYRCYKCNRVVSENW